MICQRHHGLYFVNFHTTSILFRKSRPFGAAFGILIFSEENIEGAGLMCKSLEKNKFAIY